MTTPARPCAAAPLRRAGLLVGLLAVLAGIFGMHVMTGSHGGHSPAAVSAITHAGTAAAAGHALHPPSEATRTYSAGGTSDAAPAPRAAGTPQQARSCSESGTGGHVMGGSCIPSAKTGSLSAPSPGTTVFGFLSSSAETGAGRADWSYRPKTPSPGELSISRT